MDQDGWRTKCKYKDAEKPAQPTMTATKQYYKNRREHHFRHNTTTQQVSNSTASTVNLPAASYFLRYDNLPQHQQISVVHSASVF